MPSKTVPIKRVGQQLDNILSEYKELSYTKANRATRAALIFTWGNIIKETPVHESTPDVKGGGQARGAWLIGSSAGSGIGGKKATKGDNYVATKAPKDILKGRLFLYNNLPYITTLEFGGYPKKPEKGTKISKSGTRKKPNKPAKYEIRSENGYSMLAPRGMVRRNLLKWSSTLKKTFKAESLR